MNPQTNQAQLSPEEAKAALGLSTRISEGMLMQMNPPMEDMEGSEMPENAPEPTEVPEPQEDIKAEIKGMEERIMGEIASLRDELKPDDKKTKIDSIRKELEALKNDEQE